MGAVDHLFNGDAGPDDRLLEQAASLGVILPDMPGPTPFEVWPENVPALELFLAVQTQWRPAAGGGVLGLDYGVAFQVMDLHRVKKAARRDLLRDLQVMESRAIEIINAKAGG